MRKMLAVASALALVVGSTVFCLLAPADRSGLTFLLLGSNSARFSSGDQVNAIMVAHLPSTQDADVTIVSIPRDAWVSTPGHGRSAVKAVYSRRGPAQLASVIEQAIGVPIDHVAVIDDAGFVSLTDAVGGVSLLEGEAPVDGARALAYVRQPRGVVLGDLDRMDRQQQWVRSVAADAISRGFLVDSVLLAALMRYVWLNGGRDDATLRRAARSLAGRSIQDLHFATATLDIQSDRRLWAGLNS